MEVRIHQSRAPSVDQHFVGGGYPPVGHAFIGRGVDDAASQPDGVSHPAYVVVVPEVAVVDGRLHRGSAEANRTQPEPSGSSRAQAMRAVCSGSVSPVIMLNIESECSITSLG